MFSEDAIQQVSGFTDTTREQAVLLLKKYGEAEKAVNAFFDDPEKALQEEKRGWDEPPPYHEAEVPYGPQNLEGSMFAGAPSRPPSRINSQRSLVDLTHNDAPSGEVQSLTKEQQEEQDFQQALSNSMNDVPSGQQSGITGVGQRFGPANREFYDKESWAMVPTSAAREVVHSQQPADRQRKPDEPAFLRSSPYGDRLPSLLTILHSIPLAREVLLVKELSAPRYGFDNQWWNGHTINVPKVVAYGENRDWEDIIFEVQRLMAFLDSTQRAYGSTEALSSLDHYRSKRSDTDLSKFFECWDASAKIVERRSTNCTVFSSTALKHDENGPDLGLKRDFYCLEPPVQENETTIYDVLDRVIWSDGPESLDNGFADTFIGGLGEVFTAQFTPKNQNQIGCGITIPAVWYPDRYLKEFRKEALDMRRRAQQYRLDAEKVDKQIEQVLKHKLNNGKVVDAKEVLLKAAMAVETVGKAKIPNGLTQELVTIEGKELSAAETTKCVTEIKSALDMIDKKLHDLQARREQALAACKAVMSEFTEASPDASRKPTHRYTLRGVSTSPHVTYFCSRRQIDLLVAEDALNDEWEWWRASFSKEDGKLQQQEKKAATEASDNNTTLKIDQPALSASQLHSKSDSDDLVGYTLKRVSEADVLKAATDESKSVLVVYASDAAVAYNGSPPNHQLQAFVHTDNEAFTAELSGDGDYEMISNKSSATLGNEDERADNDDSDMEPLISMKNGRDRSDSKPTSPLSPQSVSTSSFRRGGDDDEIQPSPKRSKGYNERMSLSPSGGDNLSTSPSIDRRVTDHIEGADVEKSGSHHVEYVD